MLPHCEELCREDCSNHPDTGTYCEHLYLLVQDQSDLVYRSLGIPVIDDPKAILGAQMDNVAKRVNKVGADYIMDSAFDISCILADVSKLGALNIPQNLISDLAYTVTLGLFLDNPEDTLDPKMLRVLGALKKIFPERFAMGTAENEQHF